jgi:hypothetical protein
VVERFLAKEEVAGSTPVSRSIENAPDFSGAFSIERKTGSKRNREGSTIK